MKVFWSTLVTWICCLAMTESCCLTCTDYSRRHNTSVLLEYFLSSFHWDQDMLGWSGFQYLEEFPQFCWNLTKVLPSFPILTCHLENTEVRCFPDQVFEYSPIHRDLLEDLSNNCLSPPTLLNWPIVQDLNVTYKYLMKLFWFFHFLLSPRVMWAVKWPGSRPRPSLSLWMVELNS